MTVTDFVFCPPSASFFSPLSPSILLVESLSIMSWCILLFLCFLVSCLTYLVKKTSQSAGYILGLEVGCLYCRKTSGGRSRQKRVCEYRKHYMKQADDVFCTLEAKLLEEGRPKNRRCWELRVNGFLLLLS